MRKIIQKKTKPYVRCLIPCLLLVFLLFPVSSQAALVLDFSTGLAGPGGTIDLSPDGKDATGTGIHLGLLTFIRDAAPTEYYNLSGAPGAQNYAVLDFNTSTGNFTITGSVPGLGIAQTTLVQGSFSDHQITLVNYFLISLLGIQGQGTDKKDTGLLNALHIDSSLPFNFFGFTIGAKFCFMNSYTALSTDIANTAAVPIPAPALLLASGLIGLVGIRRWRRI